MDLLQRFTSQIRTRILVLLTLTGLLILTEWYVADYLIVNKTLFHITIALAILCTFGLMSWISTRYLTRPISTIWEAVLHISPETANTVAPDLKRVHLGREMVTTLVGHIYQLASVTESIEKVAKSEKPDLHTEFVASCLPLPLVVLDNKMNVLFANEALLGYTGRNSGDTMGQNVYLVLDMLFSNQDTFDNWLEGVRKNAVTATRTWERVRLNLPDQKQTKYFDLVAYYNRNNLAGFEIMLVLFDRTRQYAQDEQAMSFLALAVHELRTPLTLLRGYIDVFEEELEPELNPELKGYLAKMKATAQQLTTFIGNVLNVSRFENDQLRLSLHEEAWGPLLSTAVNDMALRAKVRGISISLEIADDLPPVGADATSIYEVVNNLLDNAIKYSKPNGQIIVKTRVTKDGNIETIVQDFGVGIPTSAMGNLFDKFYRDYRNRTQVGGTGMGLYLSKTIVSAHGGNIWVQSKEGQGSTFGFTLVPYAKLTSEQKNDRSGIIRTAHGWIKNHSMYRR